MEQIIKFIKPELLVLAVVLYFTGMAIKNSKTIKNKYIPLSLGVIGIVLSALYVAGTSPLHGFQEICIAIFTAIVQGTLVAGLSTYVDQIIKQAKRVEE